MNYKKIFFVAISLIFFIEKDLLSWTEFGKNKVRYSQDEWFTIKADNFTIYFTEATEDLAEYIAPKVNKIYNKLSGEFFLNHKISRDIPIILFSSPYKFQQTNIILDLIDENVGGFAELFKYRIVLPYNGSMYDFLKTFEHELVHIFTFDILYGDKKSIFSTNITSPPQWLVEGIAEYFSKGELSGKDRTLLCDALFYDRLIPFSKLQDFKGVPNVYFAYKQSQSFIEFLCHKYNGKKNIYMLLKQLGRGMDLEKAIINIFGKPLNKLEEEWQKDLRKKYFPQFVEKKLPSDYTDETLNNVINVALSPGGELLACYLLDDIKEKIVLIDIKNKKIIKDITKGLLGGNIESLNINKKTIVFSQDGQFLAFVGKYKDFNVVFLYNLFNEQIKKIEVPELEMIKSLVFYDDNLLINGIKDTKDQVMLIKLNDENKKSKLFTADRPISYLITGINEDELIYTEEQDEYNNIVIFNMKTKEKTYITQNKANNWCPILIEETLLFISDIDGVDNIYSYNLGRKKFYQVTHLISSVFDASSSLKGEKIAFVSYENNEYKLYLTELEKLEKTKTEVAKEIFIKEDELAKLETTNITANITEDIKSPDIKKTDARKEKYFPRLSWDYRAGGIYYSTIEGLYSQIILSASDMLGNHRLTLIGDALTSHIDLSNIYISYAYLRRRPSLEIGLFNYYRYYYSRRGIFILCSYPINKFNRVEVGYTYEVAQRKRLFKKSSPEIINLISTALIHDTVVWGFYGPVAGRRYKIEYETTFGRIGSSFSNLNIDYRRYFRLSKDTQLAWRLLCLLSFGKDRRKFRLGGVSVVPLWPYEGDLRGYNFWAFEGDRLFLTNLELRIPFLKYAKFSIPPITFKEIRGVIFTDLGICYNQGDKVILYTRENKKLKLEDLKLSFGAGIRGFIFFFPIRIDYASATDLLTTQKAILHFSIGYDF